MAVTNDLLRIRAYYDETWLDYRLFWLSPSNYAIHFGYWDATTRTHAQALNNLNAALARRIGIRRGQRILDAGCGVGGSAIWLAKTSGVEVVGITPVLSQVERAQRFAREQQVSNLVSFQQADYTRTSFPDASFDVVWAVESVCHAADKRAFYTEASRLLKPGGRLGVVEYMRTARPLPPQDEALLQSWLSGWAIPDLATAEEHQHWATASGFVHLELANITPQVSPSLRRLHRLASVAWPGAVLVHAMRLCSEVQYGNIRGACVQYRALNRALWFDGMFTARRECVKGRVRPIRATYSGPEVGLSRARPADARGGNAVVSENSLSRLKEGKSRAG
jgi:tocopherol O-methyltransferase